MNASKPNVLLLIADQHRHDCIGAAGGDFPVRTPHYLYVDTINEHEELYDLQSDPRQRHNLLRGEERAAFRALANTLADKLLKEEQQGRWLR